MVLSYASLGAANGGEFGGRWIGWAIWLPFYGLLAAEWFRRPARWSEGAAVSSAGCVEASDKLAGEEGIL
jgi:hypothetical protein